MVHVDLLWACAKLGAIFAPLNWRLTPAELLPQVQDSEPRLLIYGPEYAAAATAAGTPCQAPAAFAAAAAQPADPFPFAAAGAEDPWLLLYTGGTTGRAKGAVLTHGSVAANAFNTVLGWQLSPDDVVPVYTPFFHTGGLNVFLTPLTMLGATLLLVTGAGFDPALALQLLPRYRVSVLFVVPTMFQLLAEHPDFAAADLSSVRFFISGGAPCPRPVMERFWARGKVFKQGYGLTEAGPNNFVMPAGGEGEHPYSVGLPLLNVQARLVDAEGRDVAAGEVGELLLAGPHVFAGYWRNPEATGAVLQNGWLHTGDLARRDEAGLYYIVDRKKDMYISGGENVYPVEVEAVLYQHPAVLECAVVGVPDAKWGEVGKAVVALRAGQAVSAGELIEFCRQRLARYKVPKSVVFVNSLPKSAAGKILRRELRG